MRRIVSALWVAALPLSARAEELPAPASSPERVRLLYEAPAECPSGEQFVGEVRSRLGGAWEAGESELARVIMVRVEKRAARYVAELVFTDGAGQKVTRAVSGVDCAVVVDGMALVTSLAIQARVDEAMSRSEAVESSPPEPHPEPRAEPTKSEPGAPPPAPRPSEKAAPKGALAFQVGAVTGLRTGVGPALALGAGGFAGVVWNRMTLELGFDWFAADTRETSSYPAKFELMAAEFALCPLSHDLLPQLELTACAVAEIGALSGEGVVGGAIVEADGGTVPWVAPGALVRLGLLVDVVFVRLEGSGRFPLLQEKFHVEIAGREQEIHEVPPFSLGAALGVGVRFW